MADRFVSLATLLRPNDAWERRDDPLPAPQPPGEADDREGDIGQVAAARDVLLFRLRVAEAVDRARSALLADLAAVVLGRELQLAPVSIDAIVAELVATYAAEAPVAIRIARVPPALRDLELPIEIDPQLGDGDAVLVVRDGSLEATLGVRIGAVLSAAERS